ncbi:MAG: hypothetical protein AAFX10_02570 [Pseudomonadota bacterium]
MNGISDLATLCKAPARVGRSGLLALYLAFVTACSAPASEDASPSGADSAGRYRMHYSLDIDPAARAVDVTLTVRQGRSLLREMRFDAPSERILDLEGDGEIDIVDGRASWRVPERGGTLKWRVGVPSRRRDGGYDAFLGDSWGIFRAEDTIPRAATRTLKGAESDTTFEFVLPAGWSAVTEYPEQNGRYAVERPGRRFAQPAGWIAVGELGVRREIVEGTRLVVAAPVGQSVRRMDMLALTNWVLPELARLLPELPERITIVSAGEPMWRGGLSGPQSLYLHADLPLISENATSTLVHELMHVSLRMGSEPGHDWIVEGLAEYYGLELLRRSGSISQRRFERSLASLGEWSDDAGALCAPASTGATTALAVTILHALDQEIRTESGAEADLDDVLNHLIAADRPLDLRLLTDSSRTVLGQIPDALHSRHLPGCPTLANARP